ncbi:hypothetical protein HDV57DRAFT_223913 [Trichoderma longibrachiatum]
MDERLPPAQCRAAWFEWKAAAVLPSVITRCQRPRASTQTGADWLGKPAWESILVPRSILLYFMEKAVRLGRVAAEPRGLWWLHNQYPNIKPSRVSGDSVPERKHYENIKKYFYWR